MHGIAIFIVAGFAVRLYCNRGKAAISGEIVRLCHFFDIKIERIIGFAARYLMLAAVLLLAVMSPARAGSTVIEDIRYGVNAGKVRVVIDLSAGTDYRAFTLADPPRLVIDLPQTDWKTQRAKPVRSNEILKSYRSGELDEGLTRIVFDLKKTAIIANAFTLDRDGAARDRVVVDMQLASDNLFRARLEKIFGNADIRGAGTASPVAKSAAPPAVTSGLAAARSEKIQAETPKTAVVTALPTPKPAPRVLPNSPYAKDRKYIVVIDAGHGGPDPGATSGRIYEKHITLAVARELRRQLEETGRYRVVMTRDKDVYIRLRDRLSMARKERADLFISIHADKIDRTDVRGASIYTLSRQASDAETARLADRENQAGVVAGVDLASESEDVAGILLDLAMREKMNESSLLARFVEAAMRRESIKLLPNSHRSAGFAVLKAPDVPSVLIETGFLSNASEAKLLGSSAFQRKIAGAIVDGVDAYFRKILALQKI
jgi:N-acetylmuramoyl-L-alanine amidase